MSDFMGDPMTASAGLLVAEPLAVTSFAPVTLQATHRPVSLSVKVTAPQQGQSLPVILLAHGHGGSTYTASMYGYEPLTLFWAAHGFAVIQPNHLDANFLGLREAEDPDSPLYLRHRAADMRQVLDNLDVIEAAVPGLAGRLDHSKVAAVGHSAGANTVGLLSGMTITYNGETFGDVEPRVGARVLIAPPGQGADLGEWATAHYPMLGGTDFSGMTEPALVVSGENDFTELFSPRRDWRYDAYTVSPGPKTQLMVMGAEHMFGGISGFDAAETSDESPQRVAIVRTMILAYLRSRLYAGDTTWTDTQAALTTSLPKAARVDDK